MQYLWWATNRRIESVAFHQNMLRRIRATRLLWKRKGVMMMQVLTTEVQCVCFLSSHFCFFAFDDLLRLEIPQREVWYIRAFFSISKNSCICRRHLQENTYIQLYIIHNFTLLLSCSYFLLLLNSANIIILLLSPHVLSNRTFQSNENLFVNLSKTSKLNTCESK